MHGRELESGGGEAKIIEPVAVADSDEEDEERLPRDMEPFPPSLSCQDREPTAEQIDACDAAKEVASHAFGTGEFTLALEKYTEAVMSGAASALVHAKRAELLLMDRRPCAAIADCTAAIRINPHCGKAFRVRGIAHRRMGEWAEAHRDLTQAQSLDFCDSVVAAQKIVAEKLQQLEARRAAEATRKETAWIEPALKRAKAA